MSRILTPTGWSPLLSEEKSQKEDIIVEDSKDTLTEEQTLSLFYEDVLETLEEQFVLGIFEALDELHLEIQDEAAFIEEMNMRFPGRLKRMVRSRNKASSKMLDAAKAADGNRLGPNFDRNLDASVASDKRTFRELPDGTHDYSKKKSTKELVALARKNGKHFGIKV